MANACMLQNYRVATLAQIFLCRIFWGCWRKILRQCDSLDSPAIYLSLHPWPIYFSFDLWPIYLSVHPWPNYLSAHPWSFYLLLGAKFVTYKTLVPTIKNAYPELGTLPIIVYILSRYSYTHHLVNSSSDINATYFPVSDFIMTVAFSVKPYKLH